MKTMKKHKKYLSYDQHQLKHLSDVLCDDIENLLAALNITEYKIFDKMIAMSCPIHGGDNDTAFNLYYQGDSYRGNWKCRTHHCEEVFKSSIIGFIRGCLSANQGWSSSKDTPVSFYDALKFAVDFSKQDLQNIKMSNQNKEKHTFIHTINHIKNPEKSTTLETVPRSSVIKLLNIPSPYFLSRGFTKEILTKYDVGDCKDSKKEMYNRAVVPVYDDSAENMVGCTGRSIYDKCSVCSSFHTGNCPSSDDLWKYSKWKHNKNFKTQDCLYNYWFAKDHIRKSGTVILVESPGNVWRLEESGIHNAVGIFGSSLHYKQKLLLDISGAMNIITIMDNDEAGRTAALNILKQCNKTYNVYNIEISSSDIAEISIDNIRSEIIPQIQRHILL